MFWSTYDLFISQTAKTPLPFLEVVKSTHFYRYFLHRSKTSKFLYIWPVLLTKFFDGKYAPDRALNDYNFRIFIFLVLPEKFGSEVSFAEDEVFK